MDKWLKETKGALKQAMNAVEAGDVPKENMYKLAPIFYSQRQKCNSDALLQKMIEANDEQVKTDCSFDADSIKQYKFHYVSSYLFCFVVAGKIDEFKYDEIMDHVNSQIELFV